MQDPMWTQLSPVVPGRLDVEQTAVSQLQEITSPDLIMLMIIFLLFSLTKNSSLEYLPKKTKNIH
jgi:hypothetical protein